VALPIGRDIVSGVVTEVIVDEYDCACVACQGFVDLGEERDPDLDYEEASAAAERAEDDLI
jgi:hypothetical protein